ncbi:chromosome segregation protein SMC [Natronocalculus amylovorans]|uniref:Chromosome segregation protein SMC n=2 Tax=Natronocalculus amylovorans TaxID=2917812 RepID=A0AAE3G1H6_9EURY|nr:archaea-specific SMC-related protein [Natronocalculus amylovorans]MCL9818179.1 chromosome segregation protein SMC [Natronocalculus amylovorans]
MGALGSDRVSLKADSEEGSVELALDGETYTRTLERRNDVVVRSGEPYLDDSTVADLFAFLLESNEARQAVARGDDLRELIMRPIDTEQIRTEIERVRSDRKRIDNEIERIKSLKSKLPTLESRRGDLREQIAEVEAELETKRNALDESENKNSDDSDQSQKREQKLSELQSAQSQLENTRFQIETETESIETLQAEIESLHEELESLPDTIDIDPAAIDAELDQLREKQSSLNANTTQLQSIIQFNEEMLNGTNAEIAAALREDESQSVTDQLLADTDSVICWTCGSEVETTQIESTIDSLRNLRKQKLSERSKIKSKISDLKTKRQDAQKKSQRKSSVSRQIDRAEREIEERKERLQSLKDRRTELATQAETLEDEIETLAAAEENETLDQHKAVTKLELQLDRLTDNLTALEREIEETETEIDGLSQLEDDREDATERLAELRTKIESIERQSVDAFNTHMESVLDILGYENIERIWIERTEKTVREGRRKVDRSVFTLHIVRQNENGAAYEDTIDHLSESEREVTGLVFALAGYLVHDVHETVPIMILDSLEAIDSNRIAQLIEYFEAYADTIVVALLPEDAEALDSGYNYVEAI